MSKHAVLLLTVILAVSALLVVKSAPVMAQFVPEFTLKLVAYPYDVPTTYGIDPYTGKNVTIQEGHHVENKSVEITIKNQPFSNLFYNVRYKGHFGEDWTEVYSHNDYSSGNLVPQSSSGYTMISIPAAFPYGEIDFQVQALSWHSVQVWVDEHPFYPQLGGHYEQRFTFDRASEWSNAQTVTFAAPLPIVTLLSSQEGNFSSSNVPLDFVVDQAVSKITYSLDSQENVTVAGNTTLSGLVNGYHNVTVYATDEAGNTGASEILFFTVNVLEPFPVVPVAAAFVIAVVAVGAGLLVYFKKRKR
jgi:hypothetical protein